MTDPTDPTAESDDSDESGRDGDSAELPDLRILGLATVAWLTVLGASAGLRWQVAASILLAGALVILRRRSKRPWTTAAGWVLAAAAALGSVALHNDAVQLSPLHRLGVEGSAVRVVLALRTDPVPAPGRFTRGVAADAVVTEVWAHGQHLNLQAPVYAFLPAAATQLPRGTVIRASGVLRGSDHPDQTAVLTVRTGFEVVRGPGPITALGNRVRAAVKHAVARQLAEPRALVPALVDGQNGDLAADVVVDFRTTGLTHLLAVSGTNLTLIVGFALVLARWARVRARGLLLVGLLGVAGFLVLTGTQPSVLRAAAMGTIALLGLGSGGRQRGVRALGVGVLFLLLVDPWLAASIGFALSVVATGGILLLAPRWREQLSRWLPRWAAELIAVPLAAQIACTPLIAAISGQISLVAVLANLLAAPLVAPATVLGLIGGLVALVYLPAAQVIAAPAGWSATGLVAIARHGAAIPQPAVAWSTGPIAVAVLALVCVVVCWSLERLLRHRVATLLAAGLMTVTMVQPLPTPGWPAPGWVMVACSVGQGDGLVLRVADRSAVVVDAGPDPRLMDQCLSRLNITVVPVVLFTHFHADHVDGLPGVLAGRRVGQIVTSSLADPAGGAAAVAREAHAAGVPERVATAGESVTIGPLRWRVLAPLRTDYPDSDSPPNDSSVVLLVQVRGLRILMMGDQERPSQSDLREHYPGLQADVLKVAHHGSSKQDTQLVRSLGARLAVISVGLNNDYGHPASSTMDLLHRAGMQVRRTDLEGDVAVVERDGVLESVAREASQ